MAFVYSPRFSKSLLTRAKNLLKSITFLKRMNKKDKEKKYWMNCHWKSLDLGFPSPGIPPGTLLSDFPWPGLFRIIQPEKKCVFFGEAPFAVWKAVCLMFDMMEAEWFPDCEFYQDYHDPKEPYGPQKFLCLILESHPKYEDPVLRHETLEKFQQDFLDKNPDYRLYEVPSFEIVELVEVEEDTNEE